MKSSRLKALALTLVTVTLAVIGTSLTQAAPEENIIRIEAGQMLEIGTDTASPKSEFSWILTKDRKFQSAQRSRFFQTRLTQLGTYVLDVSVQDPLASQNDYRAFTIIVSDPIPVQPPATASGSQKAILVTDPPLIGSAVYLPPEGGIVTLDASQSIGPATSYSLDLSNTVDSDGDGNPENDRDNAETFNEKSGSPIRFFMLPSSQPRKVWLTITDSTSGTSNRTSVDVIFALTPTVSSAVSSAAPQTSAIKITGLGMTAEFSADIPSADTAGKEVLYEWNFGDRRRSLLFTPTHTYTVPGTYTVTLTVRDIRNGQVLFSGSNSVFVQGAATGSSVSSASSSLSSTSSASGGAKTGLPIGSIIKVGFIVLLLLALAVGMYMLFTWIKRKTTGSLEKTLENMEKTIVKSDAKAGVTDAKVEPLKLKKDPNISPVTPAKKVQADVIDSEKSKTDFQSQTRATGTPLASSGPVPSWLAKASLPGAPTPKPASAPAPTPAPKPAAPLPPPSAPKTPAATGPVPDWLKPVPPPPTAPKPTQAPAPTPAPAPEPPKPVMPQIPAPAPKPVAPVPAPQPSAPVAEPATPPATAPAPQPKPAAPAPTPTVPAPVAPAPKPEAPTVSAPKPAAPALAIAPMTPAPVALITPIAPTPKPAPEIPVTPATTPVLPKPETNPEPTAEVKMESAPKKNDDSDPTIAIISADSLKK